MSDTLKNSSKHSIARRTSLVHRLLLHPKNSRRGSLSQSFPPQTIHNPCDHVNTSASKAAPEYRLRSKNCIPGWFSKCRLALSNSKTKSKWGNVLNTFFRPWKLSLPFGWNKRKSPGCMSMMTSRHSCCYDGNLGVNTSEECSFHNSCSSSVKKTVVVKQEHFESGHDSATGLQMRIANMSMNDLDHDLQKSRLNSENDENSDLASFCTACCSHPYGYEEQYSMNDNTSVIQENAHAMVCENTEGYGYSEKQQSDLSSTYSTNQADATVPDDGYPIHENEDSVDKLECKSGQELTLEIEPRKQLFRDLTNIEDDIWSDEELISSQGKGFPPPISILANETHPGLPGHVPRTLWRSVKKGGRFVLQEMQAQPREFFQATRENGRLLLQLVRPDADPSDDMMNVECNRSDSENTHDTSKTFDPNLDLNRLVCNSMADYSCSSTTEDASAASSMTSSFRVTGSINGHVSETKPNLECRRTHDDQNAQVFGMLEEDNIVHVTSKVSNRCNVVLFDAIENSSGRMDSCQSTSLPSSPLSKHVEGKLRSDTIQNNILENTLLSSNTVPNWVADNSTKLDTDQAHSSPHLDSNANNNLDVASLNQDEMSEDQFKQQQHSCFQPTYGFDNNAQVLPPNNAFFQFPIQPVVR